MVHHQDDLLGRGRRRVELSAEPRELRSPDLAGLRVAVRARARVRVGVRASDRVGVRASDRVGVRVSAG